MIHRHEDDPGMATLEVILTLSLFVPFAIMVAMGIQGIHGLRESVDMKTRALFLAVETMESL